MKLGPLRAAIRGKKGNPQIVTALYEGGPMMTLSLQKANILSQLEEAFPGGKATETHLTFDEDTGIIGPEEGRDTAPSETAPSAEQPLSLDEPLDLDTPLDLDIAAAPARESTGLDDLLI